MDIEEDSPSKDSQTNVGGVDTRKTYESIIQRKEARIAKEAQFERRARVLTKYFLRAHEEKESHKLDHLHEASQRSYVQSMEKVRDGFSSEAMMREMFREENHQISQLMQERARQRELEEQKREEKKAEREFYMQARIIHSQLQVEERQKKIEDMQLKSAEERKEKQRSNAEKLKEIKDNEKVPEKGEEKLSSAAKFDAEYEKVNERRRLLNIADNKERKQKLSARQDKEKNALDQRQKRVEKMQEDIRNAEEKRYQQVQERKRQEEDALFKKVEQMNLKGGSRLQEAPRSELHACSSRLQSVVTEKTEAVANLGDLESPKVEERKATEKKPTFDSKELMESNNLAHKEYVMRAKELEDTAERMNVDKRYKVLAEGAAGLPDDFREARLKAVHQTYMGPKNKVTKTRETYVSTQSEDVQRFPRQTPKVLRCGLCAREYPIEKLVGSALRKTVEKMRNQTANMPNNKGDQCSSRQYERGMTKIRAVSPEDGERGSIQEAQAAKQPSPVKKRCLYDYEVKLCVNCDIFVRITSS